MFIARGRQFSPTPYTELGGYYATSSINIPRLRRCKIREIRQQYQSSPHSKDSVNLRTALILHIVDAIEV